MEVVQICASFAFSLYVALEFGDQRSKVTVISEHHDSW